jgi:hypothetical protein
MVPGRIVGGHEARFGVLPFGLAYVQGELREVAVLSRVLANGDMQLGRVPRKVIDRGHCTIDLYCVQRCLFLGGVWRKRRTARTDAAYLLQMERPDRHERHE